MDKGIEVFTNRARAVIATIVVLDSLGNERAHSV
jgi:hypothetical protein